MSEKRSIKCVFIGDTRVGKSSIVKLIQGQNFAKKYTMTPGVEIVSKVLRPPNSPEASVELFMFDFCGRTIYNDLRRQLWSRNVTAIVGVFDVTREETFSSLQKQMTDLLKIIERPESIIGVILGNKCDLTGRRCVSSSDAQQLAKRYKMRYFDVSAKEMKAEIEDAFFHLTNLWIEKNKNQ